MIRTKCKAAMLMNGIAFVIAKMLPETNYFTCSRSGQMNKTAILSFLLSTIFYLFFSHTTQHNIQKTTKQNNRHILNISRSNQKGGGEGRTTRTQKLLLYIITYIQQKTLPSINGRRPGPTNSRRCTFT